MASGTKTTQLLSAEFLTQLERLSFATKRPIAGRMKGDKRSLRRGSSVEFADYREYVPGDDLRYVDWKAYARLERLFVKLFVEEEDLSVHLLLDASQSMAFTGAPGERPTKFDWARKAIAAMGYVGLIRYDRVSVAGFGQALGKRVPILRGRASTPLLFDYLQGVRAGGQTDFLKALGNYATRSTSPGVCVVVSDFMDEQWEKGVRALLARRFQIILVQVLDPLEADPDLMGDLRLKDMETGDTRDVSVTPAVVARYKEAFETFCASIAESAKRHGMEYIQVRTDTPVENLLLKTLRTSGYLQ